MESHELLDLAQESMLAAVLAEQDQSPHEVDELLQRSYEALREWAVMMLKESEADDATEADDLEFMAQLIDENQIHRLAGQLSKRWPIRGQHVTAGDEAWLL